MRLSDLGRLWRTVRHLKPIQILGRAHFLWHRPRLDLRPAPPLRSAMGTWALPAAREPSLVGPLRFRFLSDERSLDEVGWDHPDVDRLWRYNLHYFDDLNAQGAAGRRTWQRDYLNRWLAQNPPPRGTAWEPYPVSLRAVNWIKWFLAGNPPDAGWLHSLAVQVRWLRHRLEWHLLGNHLFANAKALVYAGLFFDGSEAGEWLDCGLRILERELPEQILADGGHFERSTMYHALALEDLLDLLNLVAARGAADSPMQRLVPGLRQRAGAMLNWLGCMSHPDDKLGLFNDAAHGIAPENAELVAFAARLGIAATPVPVEGITDLQASGYVRAARGAAVALLDLAPIGPDYLVGHAHADSLAFELSVHGRRLVVNGGTSCYGLGAQRLRERGTGWHSTVQVDSGNSSEVWSGFRVGRRARMRQRSVHGWTVIGAHDGWRFMPAAPLHRREWTLEADGLVVDDRLTPTPPQALPAVARFHLSPGLRLLPTDRADRWSVNADGAVLAFVEIEVGQASVCESLHAPMFGVLQAAQALAVTLRDGHARTRWHWSPDAHPVPH